MTCHNQFIAADSQPRRLLIYYDQNSNKLIYILNGSQQFQPQLEGFSRTKKAAGLRQKLRRTRKKLGDPRKCNKLDLTIITNGLIILICNGYRFQQAEEENELQIKWTLFLFLQIINKIINTQSSVRPSVRPYIHLSSHPSKWRLPIQCLSLLRCNQRFQNIII